MKIFNFFLISKLLLISKLCTGHIFIDPLVIHDAYLQLSTFFLNNDVIKLDTVTNAKEFSDLILSQENIAVINIIASDVTNNAKNTLEHIQNHLQSNIQTNLQSINKITIENPIDNILASNPELKKSTNEYLKDYYINTITPKLAEISETVSHSPSAKGYAKLSTDTTNFINNFKSFYTTKSTELISYNNNNINNINNNVINNNANIQNLKSSTKDIVNNIYSNVKINTDNNFNNFISANPKLKLSTSEYTVNLVNTEVIPKVQSTLEFLG